jgi:protein TonB
LRVARGLLRKGEAAKATTSTIPKPGPVAPESFAPAVSNVAASRPSSVPPLAAEASSANKPAQARVASAMIGSDAEPVLAKSSESSATTAKSSVEAAETAPAIKPLAPVEIEAETGALRSVSGQAVKTSAKTETSAQPTTFGFAPKTSSSAAASAPARAREVEAVAPTVEKSAAPIVEPLKVAVDSADVEAGGKLVEEPPALFSLIGDKKDSEKNPAASGRSRMALLIGTAVMLVAATVYLVSTQTGGAIALPGWLNTIKSLVSKSAPAAAPAPRPAPPAPSSAQPSAPAASPAPRSPDSAKPSSAIPGGISNSTVPSKAVEDAPTRPSPAVASVKPPKPSESTAMASKAAPTPAQPILVKHPNAAGTATVNDAPPLSLAAIAPAGNGGSLPDLAGGATAPTPVLQTVGVSQGVSQGLVLKKVQPKYPATALQMRIEGSVELLATIAKTGDISGLKILKGDPQLARAAADAVKQWKYKPYLLNGEPVEIQTQITVDFKLPR